MCLVFSFSLSLKLFYPKPEKSKDEYSNGLNKITFQMFINPDFKIQD